MRTRKLDEIEKRNDQLRSKLEMPELEKPSASDKVQEMREQLREMKKKMEHVEIATLDVGANPGKAMDDITDPLLEKIHGTVDDNQQPVLEDNMYKKVKLDREADELNSSIYEEQMKQVDMQ